MNTYQVSENIFWFSCGIWIGFQFHCRVFLVIRWIRTELMVFHIISEYKEKPERQKQCQTEQCHTQKILLENIYIKMYF